MKILKASILAIALYCAVAVAQTVTGSFKTVPEPSRPVGSIAPTTFTPITNALGLRVRVAFKAPTNEGWFIQMNPVDIAREGEWFTAPSSARLPDGTAYYDASPKLNGWWRAIRKN